MEADVSTPSLLWISKASKKTAKVELYELNLPLSIYLCLLYLAQGFSNIIIVLLKHLNYKIQMLIRRSGKLKYQKYDITFISYMFEYPYNFTPY